MELEIMEAAAFESLGDELVPLKASEAQTSHLNLPLALIRALAVMDHMV